MKTSAWIMLVVGCLILYGGLAYCLGIAMGLWGSKKRAGGGETPPEGSG